jgi:sensor histidine kinase YesM
MSTMPLANALDASPAESGHAGDARKPIWRRAFAGVTPSAIAIIAALLLIRAASTSVEQFFDVRNRDELMALVKDIVAGLHSTTIMAATMTVVIVATSNLGPQRGTTRTVALALAVLIGSGLGVAARMATGTWFVSPNWDHIRSFLVYVWARYFVIAALLTIVVELYRRERANTAFAQQAELDSVALERDLAAAQLQVLQAQIEPHFLFNTLANVRRLYDEDPRAGRTMLEMLMRYIEVALPGMRRGESTLGREAELVEAYLHIQRVRMGPRLAFAVDVPRRLRGVRVPPMMLLTLVENAVKHGLAPSREGGRIRVGAEVDGDRLRLTVADTGVGFLSASGTGIGLANVSARLASQFGDRAALALENNALGGATATIVLPLPAP